MHLPVATGPFQAGGCRGRRSVPLLGGAGGSPPSQRGKTPAPGLSQAATTLSTPPTSSPSRRAVPQDRLRRRPSSLSVCSFTPNPPAICLACSPTPIPAGRGPRPCASMHLPVATGPFQAGGCRGTRSAPLLGGAGGSPPSQRGKTPAPGLSQAATTLSTPLNSRPVPGAQRPTRRLRRRPSPPLSLSRIHRPHPPSPPPAHVTPPTRRHAPHPLSPSPWPMWKSVATLPT
jgi:hypothetical protein